MPPGDADHGRALRRELAAIVGAGGVLGPTATEYLHDATEGRGLRGRLDAVALPMTAEEVAGVVRWCYAHDVPIVPRGGGTGFAGGAVPLDGGVVLALERLRRVRAFDPLLWRIWVDAGVRTSDLDRRALENGLLFPPDPGAAEQSQIGGNIATNAGGPRAFKYGVTGHWVTGLEAVVAPGELVTVGGPIRKDAAGYDLKSLLIGSEGTLGVVTAAWIRLLPRPEVLWPVIACFPDVEAGCAAIAAVLGSGLVPASLEYFDGGAVAAAGRSLPAALPSDAGFVVIAQADGSRSEAERLRDELVDVLGEGALGVHTPSVTRDVHRLAAWRAGMSLAVTAQRGGKVSEDIVVPVDRLGEAIGQTLEIGRRHGLDACSWGHAGEGNLHATFLIAPDRPEELERAEQAAQELFALAVQLGGSVSGEHGLGWVKRGALALQWNERALGLHAAVKQAFDPKGLLNPGKKVAAPAPADGSTVRPALIEFPADDPERALRFWGELLGGTLAARRPQEGEGWQTRGGGTAVGVHARGRGPGDRVSLPYFEVDDLPAALERVRALGGSVIHPGTRWAICRDSEGSPFALAHPGRPGSGA